MVGCREVYSGTCSNENEYFTALIYYMDLILLHLEELLMMQLTTFYVFWLLQGKKIGPWDSQHMWMCVCVYGCARARFRFGYLWVCVPIFRLLNQLTYLLLHLVCNYATESNSNLCKITWRTTCIYEFWAAPSPFNARSR